MKSQPHCGQQSRPPWRWRCSLLAGTRPADGKACRFNGIPGDRGRGDPSGQPTLDAATSLCQLPQETARTRLQRRRQ